MLRALFGPSKKEIWQQVSEDIGAEYIDGGFWKGDAVVYSHGEWQVVLDNFTSSSGKHSTTYTRMRAPFVNQDNLYFKIYRKSIFSSLGKFFGMQDIEIGDWGFDDDFIIKGDDEEKIRLLLDDEHLKNQFHTQPNCSIEIRNDEGWFGPSFPEGTDQLYFLTVGVIRDPIVLEELFDLFSMTLERLVQIDSAYETDPGIDLLSK